MGFPGGQKVSRIDSQVKVTFTADADLSDRVQISLVFFHIGVVFSWGWTNSLPFLFHGLQETPAGATNSKAEVSWIALCNVR